MYLYFVQFSNLFIACYIFSKNIQMRTIDAWKLKMNDKDYRECRFEGCVVIFIIKRIQKITDKR